MIQLSPPYSRKCLGSCVRLCLIALLLRCLAAAQATINVPSDQSSIQAAIIAAHNGDTVLVAPGKYTENLNFNGKAITVTSSGGASVTVIDGGGNGSGVTFDSGENSQAVLNGFSIQNGSAGSNTPQTQGGGIYIFAASPPVPNNAIQNNTTRVDWRRLPLESA